MAELIYAEESYTIIGACFEVYKRMACGFLEAVYQECLEIELKYQGISYSAQQEFELNYRNQTLRQTFKPDFVCYDKIYF